jgi:hypothetical protein
MTWRVLPWDDALATDRFRVPNLIKLDVVSIESQVLEGASTPLRRHATTWSVALRSPDQNGPACVCWQTRYAVSALNGQSCDPGAPQAAPDEMTATRRHV